MTQQPLTWTVGTEFIWEHILYQILALRWDEHLLEVRNTETGQDVILKMADLWQADSTAMPNASQESLSAQGLSENWLEKARHIVSIVETVGQGLDTLQREARLTGVRFKRTPALKQLIGNLTPRVGLTSYYKYRRLYQEYAGDPVRIAASFRRTTFNQTRMNAAQLHLIDQVILVYGLRRPPRQPRTLYRIAEAVWKHTQGRWIDPERCEGEIPQQLIHELFDETLPIELILKQPEKSSLLTTIDLPSESWFYRYWRWFESQPDRGQAVFSRRYGSQAWEDEQMVFDTFAHRATMPLQYVFADHWLVDVFHVDEITRQKQPRLWLTLLVDAYSRCILGMALLYEHPSIQSIQSALYHTIWMKTSHRGLGLEGQWDCFGIPLQLFLDNAWAHHSYSLEDLARQISCGGQYNSIDLVFRPPYKGRYGALVERFFGNLSARMKDELPGAILSSDPKHIGQAVEQACLLYEDIDRFLHREVLVYQHTPHHELGGLTPHEKWQSWLETAVPRVPHPTAAIQRLFWRMHHETRVITHEGVSAFGLKYAAPELNRAERVGRDGRPVFYHFRYDPQDISRLALFRDGYWVCDVFAKALRRPDGNYRAVSLAERKLAQMAARRYGESGRDWLRFVNESEHLSRQRQREKTRLPGTAPTRKRALTNAHIMTHMLDTTENQDRADELAQLLNSFLDESETK
jgi:hypothetical protein